MHAKLFLRPVYHADEETNLYQTTLIRLCLLAEKLEWAQLFNASVRSFVEGEALLQRSILPEHLQFIYENTMVGSSLRCMAIDSAAEGDSMDVYIPLAQRNAVLMHDIFERVKGPKHDLETVLEASQEGVYDMREKVEVEEGNDRLLVLRGSVVDDSTGQDEQLVE